MTAAAAPASHTVLARHAAARLDRAWFRRPVLLAIPPLAMLGGVFLIPVTALCLLAVFDPSPTVEHLVRLYESAVYRSIFIDTISVAGAVTFISLALGYPVAAFLVTLPARQRRVWMFLVLVPMWMSVLIRSYAWMAVLGRYGIVNRALIALHLTDQPVQLLFTRGAVFIAMVQILLPVMILTCYSSMTMIDLQLLKAARILGATPAKAFREVFLPLSLRGALSGSAIVFVLGLAFFSTPALLGGRRNGMIANVISTLINANDWSFAATLALTLLILTLIILALCEVLSRLLPSGSDA